MRTPGIHPITIVQGAFWGSEAKGSVCDAIGHHEDCDIMVRTGTVNAGHTVYYNGFPFAMQQLPVGWTNPRTMLYLGPGAYIHPDILTREIQEVSQITNSDIRQRLIVDHRCGLHLPAHTDRAKYADRHHKMGATGKGCSEAVVDKIAGRGTPRGRLFKQWWQDNAFTPGGVSELSGLQFDDVPALLNSAYDEGAKIVIEGTQGTLLDLHLGPYPYTTHKQTMCGNWIAECGLSPSLPYEVCLVVRTFPIRVAGNSGPMTHEIGWPDLARRINRRLAKFDLPPRIKEDNLHQFEQACQEVANDFIKSMGNGASIDQLKRDFSTVDLSRIERWSQATRESTPELQKFVSELHAEALHRLPGPVVEDLRKLFELTTVTRKLRRIAELDLDALTYSCRLNRPSYIALTFINYLYPEVWGLGSWKEAPIATLGAILETVQSIEQHTGCWVRYVTTGPELKHVWDVREFRSSTQTEPLDQTVKFRQVPADTSAD